MNTVMDIEKKAVNQTQQAAQLKVVDNASYVAAGEFLKGIKSLQKEINATFDPIIKKAHEAHKEAVAQKKKVETPLLQAEAIIKPRIAAYLNEQEQKRREQEAKLQAEARKRDEEARLVEAAALEQAGNDEAAAAVLDAPSYTPPVVAPSLTPKIEGIAARETWKFRITDEAAIPREFLVPDLVKIGQHVRAHKAASNIAGVEPYAETNISAGRVA